MLPLFDGHSLNRARLCGRLLALTKESVYLGTSSWRYQGWLGSVYSPERYLTRGRFSRKRFESECIKEYAETFPLVGGDFTFYVQQQTGEYWRKVFEPAPPGLKWLLKVPEEFTAKRFSNQPRYGDKAGRDNPLFLDTDLLNQHLLESLAPYRNRIAALVFEFGTFSKRAFATPSHFYSVLDRFLAQLPGGWFYAVEIRNEDYLQPEYLDVLRRHSTAHVLNAWTRMPPIRRQLEVPGIVTANFIVTRALLRVGRRYADAVKQFEPYDQIREPNLSTRQALQDVAAIARQRRIPAFVTVNNRLEGFAPGTIDAVVEGLVE